MEGSGYAQRTLVGSSGRANMAMREYGNEERWCLMKTNSGVGGSEEAGNEGEGGKFDPRLEGGLAPSHFCRSGNQHHFSFLLYLLVALSSLFLFDHLANCVARINLFPPSLPPILSAFFFVLRQWNDGFPGTVNHSRHSRI